MSRHATNRTLRGGRSRSVLLVAAVCAISAAGGYTGALWAGDGDLDAVQIDTGHLDVRILEGDERVVAGTALTDSDRDGVSWFVNGTLVDAPTPLVYPGETWVAAIPFTVGLEGHNLLADLSLEGRLVQDVMGVGEAGFTVAEGVAAPGQPFAHVGEPLTVGLGGALTFELPPMTQADDTATYTLLVTFPVPGPDEDVRGLQTAIGSLDIVLRQNRSTEGGD